MTKNKIIIKNCASYDENGIEFEFRKKNIIFGQNGTGKTTISELFRSYNKNLSNTDIEIDGKFKNCKIIWDNDVQPNNIYVYNSKYIEEFFVKNSEQEAIFSIGENSNVQSKINEKNTNSKKLTEMYSELQEKINKLKNTDNGYINDIDEYTNKIFKDILTHYKIDNKTPSIFKDGFGASDIKKFKEKILETKNHKNHNFNDYNEFIEKYDELNKGEKKDNFKIEDIKSNFNKINEILDNDIWKEEITNTNSYIKEQIKSFDSDDIIKNVIENNLIENYDNKCPICTKEIEEDLKNSILNHFDNTYTEKLDILKSLKNKLKENFQDIQLTVEKYSIDIQNFSNINNQITEKINNPSKVIKFEIKIDETIKVFQSKYDKINDYNIAIDNQKDEISKLRFQLMKFIYNEKSNTISDHQNKINIAEKINTEIKTLQHKIQNIQDKLETVCTEIKKLQYELQNIDVTGINKCLESFGINHFKLALYDEKYIKIVWTDNKEDNNVFHKISEGEKTLISFIYFIEKYKIKNKEDATKSMFVIDDPISSLSTEHVMNVTRLIYHNFKKDTYKYILVQTHNILFFSRLLQIKFMERSDKCIEKCVCSDQKCPILYKLNKSKNTSITLIENKKYYQNTYNINWEFIKDRFLNFKENNNVNDEFTSTIPNVIRNVIEQYFIINNYSNNKKNNIYSNLSNLYHYGNLGSHSDNTVEHTDQFTFQLTNQLIKEFFTLFINELKDETHIRNHLGDKYELLKDEFYTELKG